MATILCALSFALVLIIDRPWWTKAVIILSGIPIALFVNVARIVATGIMYMVLGPGPESMNAEHLIHDVAGWLMPPVALAIMYCLMLILDRLFIEESRPLPQVTGFGPSPMVRRPAPTRVN
jgi:exosortase/archaeosortase family protein